MVSIKDVAQKANVSTATVSRVISKPEAVKEETSKKVLKAIQELNYQPNVLARQLRRLETKTILVIVPDITNTFFSKVLRGIESVAVSNGYKVILGDAGNDVEREEEYLNVLRQKQADGIVMLTARMETGVIEKFSVDYPLVLACEYIEGSTIPTVSIDNVSSARKATEYLIALGHEKIGTITGPLNVVLGKDRLKGYTQAMARHNLSVEPFLVQEGTFTFDSGYNMMMKFLALSNPPTAVFAANDEMAFGAVKAVKSRGLRVPEDVSVIGFDDIEFSAIFEPPLTTISQPTFEIGTKAMELLLKLMNEDEITRNQYILEDSLIERDSCTRNNA
ncbi:LacI family DNA-binding transcriptional regulator [Domibacillus epiphyticus]|uniref:LacI family transcriptional regulator n=1 Tax=Domibacillus epiphyticus TaxID=1714355 RepID=A0A1V2A7R5_9BACI|nr:LacI family DNA-binding transcriptional regulator [Domibacillus epiphyticus]OMP66987.1 LacI family transcriptional regulator [Domibacillus epiphyticus]